MGKDLDTAIKGTYSSSISFVVKRYKVSVEKFNTPSMRAAFKIWHTRDNNPDNVDYERAEHTALEVHAWPVEDAGRHENKKGIYVGVMFGNIDEVERRYVSFSLTRKQLQKLMNDVDARFPATTCDDCECGLGEDHDLEVEH